MKSCFAILLAGLFVLSVFPGTAIAGQAEYATFRPNHPVELGYDDPAEVAPVGPCRDDFGPDWIIYDNDRPDRLWTASDYWSRVTFTPDADFELRGLRFLPLNQYDRPGACHIRVYSEDQDSRDLDDEIVEVVIDRLPAWDGEFIDVEFEDDDFVTFEGGEHFTIVYGPAPGGAYQPGNGWWNLFDGENSERSFWAEDDRGDPPTSHRTWSRGAIDGNLFIRANGEYLEEFIDVAVVGIVNDIEKWITYPETEQTFIATLHNEGEDIDIMVVSFYLYDSEGDPVWEDPVDVIYNEDFEHDETIEIECEESWTSEEAGHYFVEVIISVEDDTDEENDFISMEHLVINPHDEEDADMWFGYCGDDPTGGVGGQDGIGWMTAFAHPGGEEELWLTAFEQFLAAREATDLQFAVAVFEPEISQYGWVWNDEVRIGADEAEWVEVELEGEDREATSFGEGKEVWICYFYTNNVAVQMDGTPPVSGVNPDMPATMYQTFDLGESAGNAESGDFMCRVKLGISDVRPDGPHLSIEPDPVEFGDDLTRYQEYTVDATFRSYGSEAVEIRMIQIAPGGRDYLTVEPDAFEIEPEEEQEVTITFFTTEDVELETRLMVINNSENMNNAYVWNVTATAEGAPQGPNLWVAPAELDFGDIVNGMDFWLETVVASVGTETAAVFDIQIPEELADFVSVEPTDFELAAGAEQTVRVTINSDEEVELDGDLIIVNNANNIDNNFALHVSAATTVPQEGSHLRFQLQTLDFGDYLALDEDYVIETDFISIGQSPVTISGITIPEEAADIITVDPSEFEMGPLSRQTVTVTFNTSEPVDLETALIVLNNSDNIDNEFEWPVTALTAPILTIDLDVIDFGEGLSICETYNVVANFTSIGSNPVIVSMIAIDQVAAAIVTIDPTEFQVADGTQEVTFSLNSHELIELETTVEIVHNAINLENPHVMNVHISVLDVEEDAQAGIPGEYSLWQNYPNPFNPLTTVEFGLKAAGDVRLDVYNMNGRLVKQVLNGSLNAGYHSVEIDASDIPAGIYIYRLNAGEFSSAMKMILLK